MRFKSVFATLVLLFVIIACSLPGQAPISNGVSSPAIPAEQATISPLPSAIYINTSTSTPSLIPTNNNTVTFTPSPTYTSTVTFTLSPTQPEAGMTLSFVEAATATRDNTPLPTLPDFDEVLSFIPGPNFTTCPGAPKQRMVVNQRGYICTQSEPVRLRDAPSRSANVLVQLPTGSQFTVTGGPNCADNWSWWQIQTDNGHTGWISEGGGEQVDPYFICPSP